MQRYASLNTCDGLSQRCDTGTRFGSTKDPLPSKTTILPLSVVPGTASKGLRTLAPWNVIRLEMSPPPVSFGANLYRQFSKDCQSFHIQDGNGFCGFVCRFVILHLSPWSDKFLKKLNSMVTNGTMCEDSVFFILAISNTFPLANVSTAETFSVSCALPSSFVFTWIKTRFSENLLAVPVFPSDIVLHLHFPQIRHCSHDDCCLRHSKFSHHHWSSITETMCAFICS